MEIDIINALLQHGVLTAVLWVILTRIMNRLDQVTDKLISILEKQDEISQALSASAQDKQAK